MSVPPFIETSIGSGSCGRRLPTSTSFAIPATSPGRWCRRNGPGTCTRPLSTGSTPSDAGSRLRATSRRIRLSRCATRTSSRMRRRCSPRSAGSSASDTRPQCSSTRPTHPSTRRLTQAWSPSGGPRWHPGTSRWSSIRTGPLLQRRGYVRSGYPWPRVGRSRHELLLAAGRLQRLRSRVRTFGAAVVALDTIGRRASLPRVERYARVRMNAIEQRMVDQESMGLRGPSANIAPPSER